MLDLTSCKISDDAIEGILAHACKIQTLILSGCTQLTDRALDAICKLGDHLDVLMLAHVSHITDRALIKVSRSCQNLRCIDVACEFVLLNGVDCHRFLINFCHAKFVATSQICRSLSLPASIASDD